MPATTPAAEAGAGRSGRAFRLLATAALLSLQACALFRPATPVPVELTQIETRVEAEEFGELRLRGLFRVRNPNDFEVVISNCERALRLDERPFQSEIDLARRPVPAGGELDLVVRMPIDGDRTRAWLSRTPPGGKLAATLQLAVRAEPREVAEKGFVTAEWHGVIPLLERPRLGFRDFSVKALGPLQADYQLVFDLLNPNLYAIRLTGVELEILIDGISFGRVEDDALDRWIPTGETVTVRIDRSQRLTRDDSRLFTILQPGRKLDLEVRGRALFSFDSPLAPLPAAISASGRVAR